MKRKPRILYLGNFSDPKFEGLMTIVGSLVSNLKVGKIYTNDESKLDQVDLINIHSSGFFEGWSHRNTKGTKIYSLHANIIPLYWSRIRDYIQWLMFVYDKRSDNSSFRLRMTKIMANIISNFTPLFVKRIILSKMDVVVVPTFWLMDKLKLKNSYLIRHGIDVDKFRGYSSKKIGEKIVVSYFGHPDSEKGIFELIHAFSKLDGKFEKRMFFTEKSQKLENFIRKKDGAIKVFGFVKNIVDEYNASDIVVLPYRHALGGIATPLVLLEAMACGKAIITTDLPHLREICTDSAVYVKPNSPKSIVEAIRKLQSDPEMIELLGKRARERAVKYYDQEKMFFEYRKLYETVIASVQRRTNAA